MLERGMQPSPPPISISLLQTPIAFQIALRAMQPPPSSSFFHLDMASIPQSRPTTAAALGALAPPPLPPPRTAPTAPARGIAFTTAAALTPPSLNVTHVQVNTGGAARGIAFTTTAALAPPSSNPTPVLVPSSGAPTYLFFPHLSNLQHLSGDFIRRLPNLLHLIGYGLNITVKRLYSNLHFRKLLPLVLPLLLSLLWALLSYWGLAFDDNIISIKVQPIGVSLTILHLQHLGSSSHQNIQEEISVGWC